MGARRGELYIFFWGGAGGGEGTSVFFFPKNAKEYNQRFLEGSDDRLRGVVGSRIGNLPSPSGVLGKSYVAKSHPFRGWLFACLKGADTIDR